MRVAIVGSGGIAQRHLDVLAQIPDITVVGHVSADPERATAQARRWGGRAFASMPVLLADAAPEAVWLCVTPDRHGSIELALIEAGVPFFVEKPLAGDLRTAETIATALLAPGGPIVAVGYKFRALDTLPRAHELLAERPPKMLLAAWHDALPSPAWWRRAAQGGGQVVEQATHLLDLARVLVGEGEVVCGVGGQWPRAEAPDSEVPDVSAALLRFVTRDGVIPGMLSATTLLRGRQAIHLQLVCEGRVLTLSERSLVID
ncbi:MAG TPA: Gfo/Idh/MocA family oxidoreductase, partial [Chloroflexota bacterium]|nr:Gfo/Idh/MocA family oxidoreductase [Chloroflexota bacterium]